MNRNSVFIATILMVFLAGCTKRSQQAASQLPADVPFTRVSPLVETERVPGDSDDPAIWIHPTDLSKSLIFGTDKGDEDKGIPGGIYAFDLSGKLLPELSVKNLPRPNNIDIEYGFDLHGERMDIAVVTLRNADQIRVFKVPEMKALDDGGIPVFASEPKQDRRPMGVSVYKRPADNAVFITLSRKSGPSGSYLWQYQLIADSPGKVGIEKVRTFGQFSGGESEIEAIATDDALNTIYYSDELQAIHKYPANPAAARSGNAKAVFGERYFVSDREGISIYQKDDGSGYILVSDQQGHRFHIYNRQTDEATESHRLLGIFQVKATESDGSEVTHLPLNERFPKGLFVAMSDNGTFHYYSMQDILEALKLK